MILKEFIVRSKSIRERDNLFTFLTITVMDTKCNLIATAVGSCLVITLYDTRHRIGAMAHAMLPSYPRTAGVELKDATYINNAIDEMLRRMYSNGSKREDIEAKLVCSMLIKKDEAC